MRLPSLSVILAIGAAVTANFFVTWDVYNMAPWVPAASPLFQFWFADGGRVSPRWCCFERS
jgi:hypothetical protein